MKSKKVKVLFAATPEELKEKIAEFKKDHEIIDCKSQAKNSALIHYFVEVPDMVPTEVATPFDR